MSVRAEKVASLIKEEVSIIFQRNFSMQEYGFLTVTEVRMAPDLKNAKIYVSVFGDQARKEKSLAMLEQQKSFVRLELGHAVTLKYTPSIDFYLDDTMDRVMKIEGILNQIRDKEKESDSQ